MLYKSKYFIPQGQRVFDELLLAGTKRKLTVKIAQSQPSKSQPSTDTEVLEQEKAAEVCLYDNHFIKIWTKFRATLECDQIVHS